MKEVNGVKIFSDGEIPDILKGLTSNFEVKCPFGIRITEENGKKILTALTKEQGLKVTRQANVPDPKVNEIGFWNCWTTSIGCLAGDCRCDCDVYYVQNDYVCYCPLGC